MNKTTQTGHLPMEEVRGERWYHTIDFPDGTTTPGIFDTRGVAGLVSWPPGLRGGRCLDIGTCDGFWAFEMERRGAAQVIAIDVDDPNGLDRTWETRLSGPQAVPISGASRGRRFDIARQALQSRVERLACSVYDLDPSVHGRFDVVLCGTLLIHLRDPIRALERMREVCAGELILVECLDTFLDMVGRWVPCARFAPVPGQWWRMNTAGLVSALRVSGFDEVSTSRRFLTPFGPGTIPVGSGWRQRLAAAKALVTGARALTRVPVLVEALGLVRGTYDIAIRARPRSPAVLQPTSPA